MAPNSTTIDSVYKPGEWSLLLDPLGENEVLIQVKQWGNTKGGVTVARADLLETLGVTRDRKKIDAIADILEQHWRKAPGNWDPELKKVRNIIDPPKPLPTKPGTVIEITNSTYPPGGDKTRAFYANGQWVGRNGDIWTEDYLADPTIKWEVILEGTD
jgi:hypothetical protein